MSDRLVTTRLLDGVRVEIFERSIILSNAVIGMVPMPMVCATVDILPAPDWPKARFRSRRGFARLFSRCDRCHGFVFKNEFFSRCSVSRLWMMNSCSCCSIPRCRLSFSRIQAWMGATGGVRSNFFTAAACGRRGRRPTLRREHDPPSPISPGIVRKHAIASAGPSSSPAKKRRGGGAVSSVGSFAGACATPLDDIVVRASGISNGRRIAKKNGFSARIRRPVRLE